MVGVLDSDSLFKQVLTQEISFEYSFLSVIDDADDKVNDIKKKKLDSVALLSMFKSSKLFNFLLVAICMGIWLLLHIQFRDARMHQELEIPNN